MEPQANIKLLQDAWLSRMKPTVEHVTPEMAREILAKNSNNRSMNNTTVAHYMEQMRKGQWQLNGESVKIATDGTLLDGQHRLEACSRLDCAFQTLVVRGVDKDTFATIDNGKVRSFADHMKIAGMKGRLGTLAAATRIVYCFTKDGKYIDNIRKMTPTDVIEFCESTNGRWLAESIGAIPDTMKKLVPISLAASLHYMFSSVDTMKTEQFFHGLVTGASLVEGSPILALRNRLISYNADRGSSGAAGRRQLVAYFIQAFTAYREGRELAQVSYIPGKEIILEGIR